MSSQSSFNINRSRRSGGSGPNLDHTEWGVADYAGVWGGHSRIVYVFLNHRAVGDNWMRIGRQLASDAMKMKREKAIPRRYYAGTYGAIVECKGRETQFYIDTPAESEAGDKSKSTLTHWIREFDDYPQHYSPEQAYYDTFIRKMYSDKPDNLSESEWLEKEFEHKLLSMGELDDKPFPPRRYIVMYKEKCGIASLT
ncbi:hypothetical protein BO86DRAFT_378869 [Aspergillus japonicus CBS 114.51]|uniref:Uncharacterized protein n=2 Tax=Aspergillus TaxID=5052 RepID=A0A2V5ICY7_ASPV1|nr:hypothetical protein BO86DRAFT_378869 [Aspergillus japonicus CBS 114.51]PYI17506.1 hypothetical protein BO99DRAFT_414156 [Aspergillus violaceofuscus CBS 115571]RAH82471.1 hypothetical protein BO86DRAFT_378869 [Aspergillus japonicus CBS 114.51]